jgi:O-acetyl-ADP-ribose deacetylase (regulator of RNase III)
MIKYVKGDLFETKCNIIAHGCNCRGGFGSGVAYTMAMKYPKVRDMYLEKHEEEGWKLGDVQFVRVRDGRVIANCATQYNYLPRGVCHASYDAIRKAMQTVKEYAVNNDLSVAIPKIGAGLAGGDWDKIESILEEVFSDYSITVYVL